MNLVEVNGQGVVDITDFVERCKAAATIATFQASFTEFHYLRREWKINTKMDALIGVGITGIAGNDISPEWLSVGASTVKRTNEEVAKLLGINPAARCTTIKPSGTSSLVLGSSSGIHAWHNDYFIRRLRFGTDEPIAKYMASEFPQLVEECKFDPKGTLILSIPQKAPEGATIRSESLFELLDRVLHYNKKWVREGYRSGDNHNNVSATLSVREDEWDELGDRLFKERYNYNGMSVLPYDGGTYVQAPFEDISKERFEELVEHIHEVDLSKVIEEDDFTNLAGEAACAGGACEIPI